ncbi:hypothetical protein ILUMI_04838, partial [Ignelater luminosus]
AATPGPSRSAPTVCSATPPPASPTPSYSEVLQRPGSAMSCASAASQPHTEVFADTDCEDGFTNVDEETSEDVEHPPQLIARHANSLISDVDNNCVEHFNSILAKHPGAIRINYCMRRSLTAEVSLPLSHTILKRHFMPYGTKLYKFYGPPRSLWLILMNAVKLRIFETSTVVFPEKVDKTIPAACVLHNILRVEECSYGEEQIQNNMKAGTFEPPLQDVRKLNTKQSLRVARAVREQFWVYFSEVGAVEWQDARIQSNDNA